MGERIIVAQRRGEVVRRLSPGQIVDDGWDAIEQIDGTVTIPEGVSIVGMEAFADCTSLMELDLPASIDINDIGAYVFRECKLNNLIIRGDKGFYANFNKYTFEGMDTFATIYCRASLVEKVKELYGGVVLPLEQYLSGIRSMQYSSDKPSAAYDLQGRRLSGQPTKGIYIQNGKKIVIK